MARGSFYTTAKIGPKQSKTPEGFLLCEEVPIARTGMMIYGPDETPVEAGPDGVTKIYREAEDIFRAETIASAQGKSVADDHPEEDVVPENWQALTVGIMMNVRRGTGSEDDLLFADLLITTPKGIRQVESGKREVSLGYDADYDEVSPGVGKQSNIIINHVALVEQGRCGPRCAIKDHKQKEQTMKRSKMLDALMKAFKAKDAAEVEKLVEEVKDEFPEAGNSEGGDTHIHVHTGGVDEADLEKVDPLTQDDEGDFEAFKAQNAAEHEELWAAIAELKEQLGAGAATGDEEDPEMAVALKDEAPEGLEEEAAKARDSRYLGESFQDTIALAEILAPGIKVPTYDGAAKPGQTFKKICGLRRQALDLAYVQPSTRGMLDDMLSGKPLNTKNMTCDAVRVLFKGAAAAKRAENNTAKRATMDAQKPTGPLTLAELNRRNAARYK